MMEVKPKYTENFANVTYSIGWRDKCKQRDLKHFHALQPSWEEELTY